MPTRTASNREMKTWKGNNFPLPATLAWLFLAAAIFSLPSARAQSVTREAVLRDLARNVIAAGYQDLAAKCQALTNAAGQLAQTPNQTSLDQARQSWTAVAEAASRVRCFQTGPIVQREYAATFYYSRISQAVIDGEAQSSNVVDQAYVAGLGGNTKGLFAVEYLLYGHKGYPGVPTPNASRVLEMLSGQNSQHRRIYLLALTHDLAAKAAQLAEDWAAPGEQGAAAKFAAGGQTSVNVMVNQLAHSVEDVGQSHLTFAIELPQPIAQQAYRIEAAPSGASLQCAVASVEGIEKFYRGAGGPGLADVLKPINAPLAKRIDEQFETTLSAVKAIGEPLDQAAVDKRDAVRNAGDKIKALEILFKVDLASALGVTISFVSGDGD